MSYLEIDNLSLSLPGFGLTGIRFNLSAGQALVILGPSGAGKSLLLEMIAGFYRPRSGNIRLDGRDITHLPPEARQIGFVFQDHALFPHRTVLQNIVFPLRFQPRLDQKTSLDPAQVMSMLRISHLAERRTTALSGGERQRVALARAMLRQPKLFLFDEPMSALDARAREDLQEELRRLQLSLGLTAVYVTHNQLEAQALGDLVCILDKGRVVQIGSREEVFGHPATPWSARFVGMDNLLRGKVVHIAPAGKGRDQVKVALDSAEILTVHGPCSVRQGDYVMVGIRPEDVVVNGSELGQASEPLDEENEFAACVTGIMPWGVVFKLRLERESKLSLTAFVTKQQLDKAHLKEGSLVRLSLPPKSLHLMVPDAD